MKVFTFDNLTTGSKQESNHAETEQDLIKVYQEMGQQIQITDVFDPDAIIGGPGQIHVQGEPPLDSLEPPLPGVNILDPQIQSNTQPVQPKTIFFETNGIKFKVVDGVVSRKDWIKVEVEDQYKVVKKIKGKGNSTREQDITKDVTVYKNDWVEVEQKDDE